MEGPKRNTFTNFGFGVLERLTMADESSRNASNRTNNATDTNKIAVSGKSCVKLADPYMIGESQGRYYHKKITSIKGLFKNLS